MDALFDDLRRRHPDLLVERLAATHAGDDDNVYFLSDAKGLDRVQLDTGPHGQPPFLIEAEDRLETSEPTTAAVVISAWLGYST